MPLPRIPETLKESLFQNITDWIYAYPELDELYDLLKELDETQLNYVWAKLRLINEENLKKDDFNNPSAEEIRSIIEDSKRIAFFKEAVSEVMN